MYIANGEFDEQENFIYMWFDEHYDPDATNRR